MDKCSRGLLFLFLFLFCLVITYVSVLLRGYTMISIMIINITICANILFIDYLLLLLCIFFSECLWFLKILEFFWLIF